MMDYKKIIKSRSLRLKILRMLRFIPDKPMLKLQYRIKMGRSLNLKNPQRFTEKMQWYKLYYKNPLMIQCVDKYDVRQYLDQQGYRDILLQNFGVYNSFDEIKWDELPDEFVIKDTLGGGGNSVFICRDKSIIDIEMLESLTKKWLGNKLKKSGGREWPYYSGKKNRLIVEEFLACDDKHGLVDYKFLCLNGKVELLYIMCDRVLGQNVKLGLYDRNLNLLPVCELTEDRIDFEFKFPENINSMIMIAENLSKPFPQVRIDMYSHDGKIYFGEFTFFDESGYMIFDPDSFDYILGEKFILKKWESK